MTSVPLHHAVDTDSYFTTEDPSCERCFFCYRQIVSRFPVMPEVKIFTLFSKLFMLCVSRWETVFLCI